MTEHREKPQERAERCLVCEKPIAKGEGRYRLKQGPVHVECRGKVPEDEQ